MSRGSDKRRVLVSCLIGGAAGSVLVAASAVGCGGAQGASQFAVGEETAASVAEGSAAGPKAKASPAVAGKNVPAIKVDTVGYPTTWRKIAIFNVEPKNAALKDAASGAIVHPIGAAAIKNLGKDEASQDPVWQVDFTAFNKPGKYVIEGGGAKSDPFEIGDGIYATALKAGMKHFYFQRCRTALTEPHATWEGTSYTRKGVCHAHEDVGWDFKDYPNKKRRFLLEAGWHDAGNYEMYIPSTAPTAQALLMAFEANPEVFPDKHFDIPESGNGVPDVLDEVKWGLRWILTMQEKTGAFRMRDALYKWGKHGAPEEDKETRWVSGVGSAATAKATAVLAMAARIYKKYDAPFAERCDKAARAGWAWLEKHPDRVTVDPKGSPQPLWDDGPDAKSDAPARFVAAVEIWRSFRLPAALDSAKKLFDNDLMKPDEFVKGAWVNLSRYGVVGLALDGETPADLRQKARAKILEAVKPLRAQVEQKDGYRCMSRPDEYLWGHNSNLMERAHLLLVAQKLDPAQEGLLEAVRDQWHWVLGRNPNGYSMVTRVGKGPEALYHLEWHLAKPLPPGYMVGGPNAQQMRILSPDAPAKALLWDNPQPMSSGAPAHQLWHSEQSDLWDGGWLPKDDWTNGWWAVTEPDIYYNANFVLVAAAMQK